MSELDNRAPVEPRHEAFAQALVALAREHRVRHIRAEYYGGAAAEGWTKLTLSWTVGPPGTTTRISLRAEAIHHCDEQAPNQPDPTGDEV